MYVHAESTYIIASYLYYFPVLEEIQKHFGCWKRETLSLLGGNISVLSVWVVNQVNPPLWSDWSLVEAAIMTADRVLSQNGKDTKDRSPGRETNQEINLKA